MRCCFPDPIDVLWHSDEYDKNVWAKVNKDLVLKYKNNRYMIGLDLFN